MRPSNKRPAARGNKTQQKSLVDPAVFWPVAFTLLLAAWLTWWFLERHDFPGAIVIFFVSGTLAVAVLARFANWAGSADVFFLNASLVVYIVTYVFWILYCTLLATVGWNAGDSLFVAFLHAALGVVNAFNIHRHPKLLRWSRLFDAAVLSMTFLPFNLPLELSDGWFVVRVFSYTAVFFMRVYGAVLYVRGARADSSAPKTHDLDWVAQLTSTAWILCVPLNITTVLALIMLAGLYGRVHVVSLLRQQDPPAPEEPTSDLEEPTIPAPSAPPAPPPAPAAQVVAPPPRPPVVPPPKPPRVVLPRATGQLPKPPPRIIRAKPPTDTSHSTSIEALY